MGAQGASPRIGLGKSMVKGLVNQEYALGGAMMIVFGIAFSVIGTDLLSNLVGEKLAGTLALGFGFVIVIIGGAVLASAWAVTMDKVYLRNGSCQIIDGKVRCTGGCTQCVFAARYVQMKNPVDGQRPRERWHPLRQAPFYGSLWQKACASTSS